MAVGHVGLHIERDIVHNMGSGWQQKAPDKCSSVATKSWFNVLLMQWKTYKRLIINFVGKITQRPGFKVHLKYDTYVYVL